MSTISPSYSDFQLSAAFGKNYTFVKKIPLRSDAFSIYRLYRDAETPSILLESVRKKTPAGRYSIIAKNPLFIYECHGQDLKLSSFGVEEILKGDAFLVLKKLLREFHTDSRPGWPPFTCGAIGFFGYEAKNWIEPSLSCHTVDDLGMPSIYFLFFDECIVVDHEENVIFLTAHIRAGKDLKKTYAIGQRKLQLLEKNLCNRLEGKASASKTADGRLSKVSKTRFRFDEKLLSVYSGIEEINSSLSREEFINIVQRAKDHIKKGDIYQANLSQRLTFPFDGDGLEIYEKLRSINPSPFFGYLDAVHFQILSGSPERLIKLENRRLETRPIAGTRSRGRSPEEDRQYSLDLLLNEKERAEHVMLVDLERNDLGRVAEYGSVCVDELMTIEDYSHVKHIVSNVRGTLKHGLDAVDAIKAVFPGGTITGAPKIRCMEIIDELEPVSRGPYTGSLGYFSFTGDMDFNIIIRSLILKDRKAHLQVGAGIVADSVPWKEYEETLYKAQGVLCAVFGEEKTASFFAERGLAVSISK